MRIIKNVLLFFAAGGYYWISKSALSAMVMFLCFALYILDTVVVCLQQFPKWQRGVALFSIIVAMTGIAASILNSQELVRSSSQLFFALTPVIGYILGFALHLLPSAKEKTKKFSEKG